MTPTAVAADPATPLRLRILPGVFAPRSDAELCARVLARHRLVEGADVLDLAPYLPGGDELPPPGRGTRLGGRA